MKATPLLFALASLSVPLAAQEPGWADARRVAIALSSFKYDPSTISLEHGRPYVLRFANTAGGGHDFVAKRFFAAARIAPADRARVKDGEVELAGGEAVEVRLIAPAAGRYDVHCSHFLHATFGMTGRIEVR